MPVTKSTKPTPPKKKNFSSFNYKSAFKQLNITQLMAWGVEFEPIAPSDFFHQHLARLQCFDLQSSEESKKLIIDAILAEAIQRFPQLKIWKSAELESDRLTGEADYLIAAKRAYLEAPFACVVEAKRDDFYQGTAQCLVEMQACQWNNQQLGRDMTVFGIVTNGTTWQFYQLLTSGEVYETLPYSISDLNSVLGLLQDVFQQCESNLGNVN
ncbi:MAG: hypothetical protein MUF49_21470 [Oculatellaceae cyanobacterium Prado106]|jgi:hypothetical protein|nr:hypothetical protein [Oculatellaceae cyanobacterium Prado106]